MPLTDAFVSKMEKFIVLFALILTFTCCQRSSVPTTEISHQADELKPYTICQFSNGLTAVQVDRLPGGSIHYRTIDTSAGAKRVSMVNGYRLLLAFPNTRYFANIKVEQSDAKQYSSDKEAIIKSLELIAEQAKKSKTEIEHRSYNGFDIYGLNNPKIEIDGPISMYLLFRDATHTVVTIYFLNQAAEYRKFQSMEEYINLRDNFLEEYTRCINGAA